MKYLIFTGLILALSYNTYFFNNTKSGKSALAGKSYKSLDSLQSFEKITDTSKFKLYNSECAINIMPDPVWIEQQRKTYDENSWNAIVLDNAFYTSQAMQKLESMQIKTVWHNRTKNYMKFVKSDKKEFLINCKQIPGMWGLILFNGKDNPVLWSGDNIEEAIKEIYGK